ncbi:hypothetical protein PMAYCL1PPCAC_26624 [Pristionchus mayeri]|uniref:Uncharacterized protein n=1 Tax=Pristionchus mayeri TaxID=1317129 RepID=A0AAN5I9H3_9BILA|nr:hypothetical protein PMAYCL1PPCAC_26624 [Pristionchus mayeri]
MVSCRGCCSSIVIVLLVTACGVIFILHSLYYVLPYLQDNVGTKETVKRLNPASQRMPSIIICNRQPFSVDGINLVSSSMNNDNTKRYLREWTNGAARDYPEYSPPTAVQNTEAINNINQNLPQTSRKERLQQMAYQCGSVINSCTFNGNTKSGADCCPAVSRFVPTMNGICLAFSDALLVATLNTTLPQLIMTFTIPRNSWYSNESPTHPGIDIYLRETVDDAIRLASDLETPPLVTLRDKQGVRLRVRRENRIDGRRLECGTNTDSAASADTNARTNNKANMLTCAMTAAMTACGCHPLLAENLNYNTTSTSAATQFWSKVNSTTVCTLDQYDQCARRYVETARSENRDEPIPSDLTGRSDLENCRRDNAFPCLRVAYSATPEPYPLPSSYTTSTEYVSRLTIDFASLATFEVLQERAIPLFEMLSNVGYNIALWFAVGHILWTLFAEARDVCCKPVRVGPSHQPVNGSKHLAPASLEPAPETPPPTTAPLVNEVAAPKFSAPPPPASSPPPSAAVSRSVHFTPPPPAAAGAATPAVPSPPATPPSLKDPDSEVVAPVPAPRRQSQSISVDLDEEAAKLRQ